MKVVINARHGGFGLSNRAFLWLIDCGVPVKPYIAQVRNEETGLWTAEPCNHGEHVIDYEHPETTFEDEIPENATFYSSPRTYTARAIMTRLCRFSADWLTKQRHNPLLVECVETLGVEADGSHAKLKVVEIPDGTDYTIEEYDGLEHVAEKHRSWS